jgi:hypothetical protein
MSRLEVSDKNSQPIPGGDDETKGDHVHINDDLVLSDTPIRRLALGY